MEISIHIRSLEGVDIPLTKSAKPSITPLNFPSSMRGSLIDTDRLDLIEHGFALTSALILKKIIQVSSGTRLQLGSSTVCQMMLIN